MSCNNGYGYETRVSLLTSGDVEDSNGNNCHALKRLDLLILSIILRLW